MKKYPQARIRATGHSLGAVFATYATIDIQTNLGAYNYDDFLKNPDTYGLFKRLTCTKKTESIYSSFPSTLRTYNKNITVVSVYTFGMPRIGNIQFADYIHRRIRIPL